MVQNTAEAQATEAEANAEEANFTEFDGIRLQNIELNGQKMLTTSQLAEAYGTNKTVISNNFKRNSERYKEGKHYYCFENAEKREFCNRHHFEDGAKASVLYLWTEKGALLHAKSLNTDKA